jgi:hypothetical protein
MSRRRRRQTTPFRYWSSTLLSGWKEENLPLPPMTETVNGFPDLAFSKKVCTLLPVP